MRYPGRVLGSDECLPAPFVAYVAEQLAVGVGNFERYAHREPTRVEHVSRLLAHLGEHNATAADRRAALLAAMDAAIETDDGLHIATAVVKAFRSRNALLPSDSRIEKIGLAARAIARRRAEAALLSNFSQRRLEELDDLLKVDTIIGQTRFSWLRTAPDAPGADNLVGLIERLSFVRSIAIDPHLQNHIHSKRWTQMVKEGDVTPAWLAADFNAGRRRATIVVQLITLAQNSQTRQSQCSAN
ncbi:protein of unknown function [Phyllobacterium sp. OV277]|nr:protein of unknown function [Phyllobacterium sp. OV277]